MLHIQYLIVATSEAVVNFEGPANLKGNRATIREPSFRVKINTRLKPPSFFSQCWMDFLPWNKSTILWQRLSKSRSIRRISRSCLSFRSHRPLVYEWGSSAKNASFLLKPNLHQNVLPLTIAGLSARPENDRTWMRLEKGVSDILSRIPESRM